MSTSVLRAHITQQAHTINISAWPHVLLLSWFIPHLCHSVQSSMSEVLIVITGRLWLENSNFKMTDNRIESKTIKEATRYKYACYILGGGRTRLIEGAPLMCAMGDMQMSLTIKRAFCTASGGRWLHLCNLHLTFSLLMEGSLNYIITSA